MKILRVVTLAALMTQLSSHAFILAPPLSELRNAHWILQFRNFPGPAVRRQLARRGIRVLEYVPDSALLASFRGTPDLAGLDIAGTGQLTPADRTVPGLEKSATFLVVFHCDVARKDAQSLLAGFQVLDSPGLPANQFLIAADLIKLPRLAALDEVSYIRPSGL
jgi:hypothetical protein